jgi:hypothetical protein
MKLLSTIAWLFPTVIPAERGYKIQEERELYEVDASDLLTNIPMP